MATNMEKVTKALSDFGHMDVKILAELTKVSIPALYKLSKQGNSVFAVSNGSALITYPGLHTSPELDAKTDGEETMARTTNSTIQPIVVED